MTVPALLLLLSGNTCRLNQEEVWCLRPLTRKISVGRNYTHKEVSDAKAKRAWVSAAETP